MPPQFQVVVRKGDDKPQPRYQSRIIHNRLSCHHQDIHTGEEYFARVSVQQPLHCVGGWELWWLRGWEQWWCRLGVVQPRLREAPAQPHSHQQTVA